MFLNLFLGKGAVDHAHLVDRTGHAKALRGREVTQRQRTADPRGKEQVVVGLLVFDYLTISIDRDSAIISLGFSSKRI